MTLRRLIPWLAHRPVSYGLAVCVLVSAALAGTLTTPASSASFSLWGWSYTALTSADPSWWTLVTSVLVPPDPLHTAVFVLACLGLLGRLEPLIGSWRLLLAVLFTSVGATVATLVTQWAGVHLHELWLQSTLDQTILDPLVGLIGAVMAATAFMPTLWRRRVRLFILVALATYVLYSGDAVSLVRGFAALLGLGLGPLLARRRPAWRRLGHASRRETRTLLALVVGVTAVGPLIAASQSVSIGPLSAIAFVFALDESASWITGAFALIPLILLPTAWGIRSGRRVWLWLAVVLELLLALGATYSYVVTPLSTLSAFGYSGSPTEINAWWVAGALIPLGTAIILLAGHRHLGLTPITATHAVNTERRRFRQLLQRHGGGSLGFMGTWPGNAYWFTPAGDAAVAYRVIDGVALTVSDPIAPPELQKQTITDFIQFCDQHGWIPVFYSVHPRTADILTELGWYSLPVADEATLDPASFSLHGPKQQNLRTAINRAEREGVHALWRRYHDLPLVTRAQIVALSEQWVADKHLPELGFTLGGLSELQDPDVRLMVAVDHAGRVHAVTSWLPIYDHGQLTGWTLDFMRRRDDAVPGVTDYLITETLRICQADGVESVSLAGTPLVHTPSTDPDTSRFLGRLLAYLGRSLEPLYGFRSLAAFKHKYHPTYASLSLIYRDPLTLGQIGKALAKAYLPGLNFRHILPLLQK